MPVGIEIRGSAGNILIDHRYFNLVLRQKVASVTAADSPRPGSKITLTYTGSFPLIAWQSAEEIMMQGFSRSGDTWTFVMRCRGGAGTAYTLFVFGEPSNDPDIYGHEGLEVRNPVTKKRIFHSGAKPAVVVEQRGILGVPTTRTDIALTPGRQYATAMLSPAVQSAPAPASPGPPFPPPFYIRTFFAGCRGYAGGVSYAGWMGGQSGPYPGTTAFTGYTQGGSAFLVLDVTNF